MNRHAMHICYDIYYMNINIRLIYLYLFAFVGLLIVVIGSVRMVDLSMKIIVFKNADKYEYAAPYPVDEKMNIDTSLAKEQADREQTRNRQREFSGALSMIVVGLPLYLYHWKTIQKENRKKS